MKDFANIKVLLARNLKLTASGIRSRIDARLKRPFWKPQPNIWIDVTILAAHDAATGIQRVTRAIASELINNPPRGWSAALVRFDHEVNQFRYADRASQMMTGKVSRSLQQDALLYVRQGDLWIGLDLVPGQTEIRLSSFKHYKRKGVRIVHILYDLLVIRHPEWADVGMAPLMERWAESITMNSDGVIAISKAALDDYKQWLAERDLPAPSSLSWFHLGADVSNSLPSSGIPANGSVTLLAIQSQPAFLMVGTLEPRKGHSQSLAAFELLWDEGLGVHLVIVGKPGWGVDELIERLQNHPENGKRLFFLEAVSDEYLEEIYKNSTVLLAASEGEGFGLPLIEAAHHQLPILARDLLVFREVAGDQALYFSGNDPAELAAAVRTWLSERVIHDHPPNIRWLTWEESCDQLVAALGLPSRRS